MPFQNDTGASSEDSASNDTEFFVFFCDMVYFSLLCSLLFLTQSLNVISPVSGFMDSTMDSESTS